MMTIAPEQPGYTVLARLGVKPDDQAELLRLSTAMLPVFARQPGFVAASLHRATDATELLLYLQWRSQADSDACLTSPEMMSAGQEWMAFVRSGKATFALQPYEVVTVATASSAI